MTDSCKLATCLLVFMAPLSAQGNLSSLTGIVTYPTATPVAGAPIQVKNKATGTVARTVSSSDGHYKLAGLAAGPEEFSIVMPCCAYQRVSQEFSLEEGKPLELNIKLVETVNGSTLGDDPARLADAMRQRAKVPTRPAPRTPTGKPDLSGVWLIKDDPYPEDPYVLPWAAELIDERRQNNTKDAPHNRCLPGPPPAPGSASPFIAKFLQTPPLLVILIEDYPGFRQIFLDVPAATAWRLIDELAQDERIAFVSEPALLDSVFPTLLNSPVPTGRLIGDAYLAAFSIAGSRRMVTLDRGFRQFKGLDVEILTR